jgi:hypothetical protein
MRAEFFRSGKPEEAVGVAEWDGRTARIHAEDDEVRRALTRVFRPSAVSLEDPTLSDPAASGPALVEPGDLRWFRTAALVRGKAEGLSVRFVTDTPGGWDPAGAYRPLEAWTSIREGGPPPRMTLGTSRA